MIRTNIKLQVTPQQSAKIQQICFDNKIYWNAGQNFVINTDINYLFIDKDSITSSSSDKQSLYQHEFEEVDPELFISTNGSCKTTNTFKEYGFEVPNFQCKLYDKLDDYILGAYFNPNKQKWTMCRWGFDGRNKQGSPNYALTPVLVHKPWYETCKFPCIIMADDCMPVVVKHYNDGYVYDFRDNKYCVKSWTPLTDTEIEELKRGF